MVGEEAENGVHAGSDGNGHRQDVIDQESAPGDEPRHRADEFGGHQVAAAPGGEIFNDLGVTGRKDKDRGGDREGQGDRQVGVMAQGAEGFFGAVTGGGQPVRPQADPGKKGDEGNIMENVGVQGIFRSPKDPFLKSFNHFQQLRWSKKKRLAPLKKALRERDGPNYSPVMSVSDGLPRPWGRTESY